MCSPHNSSEPASPTKSKYPHPALAVSAPSCAPHNQTSYFLLSLRLVRAKYPTYPTPPKSIPFLSHPSVARAICPCADTPCASPYLACGSIRASFFCLPESRRDQCFPPKITIIGVMKKPEKKNSALTPKCGNIPARLDLARNASFRTHSPFLRSLTC